MPRFRKIKENSPKSIPSLIFDLMTLMPINEIYVLLLYVSGSSEMNMYFCHIVRTKSVLRLYRVHLYNKIMKSQAGRNQILIIWLSHFVTVALFVHFFAAIWYNMGCWKCTVENWTDNLNGHFFDPSSVIEWFIICYTTIGAVFQHCDRGNSVFCTVH